MATPIRTGPARKYGEGGPHPNQWASTSANTPATMAAMLLTKVARPNVIGIHSFGKSCFSKCSYVYHVSMAANRKELATPPNTRPASRTAYTGTVARILEVP